MSKYLSQKKIMEIILSNANFSFELYGWKFRIDKFKGIRGGVIRGDNKEEDKHLIYAPQPYLIQQMVLPEIGIKDANQKIFNLISGLTPR